MKEGDFLTFRTDNNWRNKQPSISVVFYDNKKYMINKIYSNAYLDDDIFINQIQLIDEEGVRWYFPENTFEIYFNEKI